MFLENKNTYIWVKDAPLVWFNVINEGLKSFGLQSSVKCPCLHCGSFDGHTLLVCFYVDEILHQNTDTVLVDKYKAHFKKSFNLQHPKIVKKRLGVEITDNESGMIMSAAT